MNPTIFNTGKTKTLPKTDTVNLAGGKAYAFTDQHELVQMAVTGCFNDTFYASAKDQVSRVLSLAQKVPVDFLAKTAIYARKKSFMKDMPALLLAILATRDSGLFKRVFPLVVDNEKMLKNFITVLRSGVTGRKSCNYAVKKAVNGWLLSREPNRLFTGDIGSTPSLAQVIKLTHPATKEGSEHDALFKYLLDKEYVFGNLPSKVREYEAFKKDMSLPIPDVPFQALASLNLTKEHWIQIAKNASWQTLRMNLNTFERHGVFKNKDMTGILAKHLKDPERIQNARVFPYQLLTTYLAQKDVPTAMLNALSTACDIACQNIPSIDGAVLLMPDVSGSMSSAVTGTRKGSTSATRCIDVAGLVSAAFSRRNIKSTILPFDYKVHQAIVPAGSSVLETAKILASLGGGGTDCSLPLKYAAEKDMKVDLAIFISDNESWIGSRHGATATMEAWKKVKAKNPGAKLVCIDLTPNGTTQALGKDVLNIGGFSDSVFEVIALFARGELRGDHFVEQVQAVTLPE